LKTIDKGIALDRDSRIPLYGQVAEHLRNMIELEVYKPGSRLPSTRELCDQFGGINHQTVRQAFRELTEEGLLESAQGRGIFVKANRLEMRSIALVLPNLEDEQSISIARGLDGVLLDRDVRTVIMDSHHDSARERDNIRHLEDLPLDGAVVFPVPYGDIAEQVFRLKLDRFPVVLIDRYFKDISMPCVTVDNYGGMRELVALLTKGRRRRVAWIGETGTTSLSDRFDGYRDALGAADLPCDAKLIKHIELPTPTSPFEPEIKAATRQLARLTPRPDAVVYGNDLAALIGIRELRRLQIDIPREIAVVGFDDIGEAATSDPPLTTVHQPMEKMGGEAGRMLLKHIDDSKRPPEKLVLPVTLVRRKSGP